MPQEVTLPDGSSLSFPDNMSPDQMKAAIYSQPQWKKYAPKVAAPIAVPPVDRKAVDKFRMDYFNTDNPNANIPMKTARALAANPKDPKALDSYRKMNPVSQAAIREKADEFAKQADIDKNSVFASGGPSFGGESPMGPALSMDKRTGQANYVPPSHYIAEAIHGPEGARKLEQATGAPAELERLALSMSDPENLAFMAAGGMIANTGKLATKAVLGAIAAQGIHSGYQKAKKGDYGGAAVDVAAGLAPAAIHGIAGKIEARKTATGEAEASSAAALKAKTDAAKVVTPPEAPKPELPKEPSFEMPAKSSQQTGEEILQGRQEQTQTPEPFKPTHEINGQFVEKRPLTKGHGYFDEAGKRVPIKGAKVNAVETPEAPPRQPGSHIELDAPNRFQMLDIPDRPFTIREDILEQREAQDAAGQTETAEGKGPAETPVEVKPTEVQTAEPEQSVGRDEAAQATEGKLAPEDIKVMQDLQYKKTGITRKGKSKIPVTDSLQGTQVFDVDQGGKSTVFKDEDGQHYIVNGHHRLELGQRATSFIKLDPKANPIQVPRLMDVNILDAKDGWTLPDARVRGVLENVRDGNGTAIDAVEALHHLGMTPEKFASIGVSMSSDMAKNVAGLMDLDPQAIARIHAGDLKEQAAAGIGSVKGLTPEAQRGAADEAARRGFSDYDKGAALAREYLEDQQSGALAQEQQDDLFGGEFKTASSTRGLRVEIRDAVERRLLAERSSLLKPLGTELRSGEQIDTAGRQAEAQNMAESAKALKERLDHIYRYQDAVKAETARLATEVGNDRLTKEQASKELADALKQHIGRSPREISEPGSIQFDKQSSPARQSEPGASQTGQLETEETKGLFDKLSDAADAARDRLGKPRLGAGIPADMLKDLAVVAADHMVKLGTRSYAAFEKSMIDEYGPEVRASLNAVYNAALQNHGPILPAAGAARPGTPAAAALSPPPVTPSPGATLREGPVKATGAFRQMGKFGKTMLAGINHIAGSWDLGKLDSEIAKRQIVSENNLNASEKQQLSDYLLSNTLRARAASNPSFASDFGGDHPQMMTPAEETRILSNPKIAAAVHAYKAVLPHFTAISMEEGLTPEVQAKLGEDYFPLHRLDPEGPVEGNGKGGSTQPVGQKMRTQKNKYTLHAGGNAPEYMSDIDSTLDQVYGHLTKLHAKNQFYRDAKALGYVADTPEQARDLWGSEYRGIEMSKTSDGKVITKYFPRDVEGMLRKALVTEPNVEHPTGVKVLQGFNKANMTMRLTFNIPELLGHGRAYPVQLRALPPKTMPFFGKLIQSIPYIGDAKVGKAMFDLDFDKPEMRQVLRDIYSAHGGSSRPFQAQQSATIDKIPGLSQIQHGVHEGLWSLPEGKGFKGWDTRGAVYAEMIRRSYEHLPDGSPDLDPARIREFQANFRQYMSHPDWWIKGISSFHPTAKTGIPKAMSMLKQTAGVSGIHSASTGDAAALAAQTVAMRTVAPAVSMLLANRALSGHWIWDNKPGHKFDVQLTHNGPNAVYATPQAFDPALSYAMNTSGLHAMNREQGQKPWSNKTKGKHQGKLAQEAEDVFLGGLNLASEQIMPPALDTALQATTGKAAYFQRKPGGYQPEMVQTTDPKAQLGARSLQAFMQTFGPTSTLAGAENNPNRPQGLAWALLNYTLMSKQLKVDPKKKVHPQ